LELLIRTDRIQVHLLRQLLAMHGIKAHIFNEHMQSVAGEVPLDAALPQLWLDDELDRVRALALLREHEVSRQRTGSHYCRQCREENPASFELCWHCGAEL